MTVVHRRNLPSKLLLEKVLYDDGRIDYFLTSKGTDPVWHPGTAYCITKEEYDALYPLSREVSP